MYALLMFWAQFSRVATIGINSKPKDQGVFHVYKLHINKYYFLHYDQIDVYLQNSCYASAKSIVAMPLNN